MSCEADTKVFYNKQIVWRVQLLSSRPYRSETGRRFGGKHRFRLQDLRVNQEGNQQNLAAKFALPKLHGFATQKAVLVVTVVRASDPTNRIFCWKLGSCLGASDGIGEVKLRVQVCQLLRLFSSVSVWSGRTSPTSESDVDRWSRNVSLANVLSGHVYWGLHGSRRLFKRRFRHRLDKHWNQFAVHAAGSSVKRLLSLSWSRNCMSSWILKIYRRVNKRSILKPD
jgi:hypothetical protein